MADTEGKMADTRFGGAAKADTRQRQGGCEGTHGGHMADKGVQPRRTQGGHLADTRWTHSGQGLEARPKQTHGGHAPDTRPAFFSLRENPTVDCLGKNLP